MKFRTLFIHFFVGKRSRKLLTILVCLFIASIFWIFNSLNNDYSAIVRYPIKFEYDKSKYFLHKPFPKHVSVAVSGYGWELLAHTLGIDLKPVVIRPENLVADRFITTGSLMNMFRQRHNSINVNHFMEDTLVFETDSIISKQVYLKLDLNNVQLPKGRDLKKDFEISPSFITCSGPKAEIQTVPDSIFFRLPISFIEETYHENVPITYRPTPNITQNTQEVSVKLSLK
jgi:hypothetical protein